MHITQNAYLLLTLLLNMRIIIKRREAIPMLRLKELREERKLNMR